VTQDKPASITLDIPGGTICGLRTGSGASRKMLCLHGWLDNANSFLPIMPHIEDTDIVALDLPGHGLSDHHCDGFPYTIATYAHRVLQASEALGWHEFHLAGHSLGGSIVPLCAIVAADNVKSIVMIDALGPLSESAHQLPDRLKRFHKEFNDPQKHRGRTYSSMQQAVESRLSATKMYPESARLIVERQLLECEQGFRWRFDRQLRLASPAYYTESQVREILQAITCPVLCLLAIDGYLLARPEMISRLSSIKHKTTRNLPGHHHLHMDTPAPVAEEINHFLASLSRKHQ